jgi:Tol biopolymer transport system component
MPLNAGSRLGPYEIVSRIGAGGMGEVFKARDTRLERSVAIKVLPSEFASNASLKLRFEREAKTISQLNHPNICTLYDVGESAAEESNAAGQPASGPISYLVMELLEGETLSDRIARGPLLLAEVLRYGAQIADALDRAHRAGVVHRDLKPGNIMITRGGAKLLDFGLAKSRDAEAAGVRPSSGQSGNASLQDAGTATAYRPLTQEGTIVGTFQYMAPEQLAGEPADARTDIFSFGCVLYEMVTGRHAFEGKTRTSLIAAILSQEPAPIATLQPLSPPALERVIMTCLAKEPDDRWQSAHDLKRELEWIRDGASQSGAAAVAVSRSRRLNWAWVFALLWSVGVVGAAWLWVRASTPAPRRIVSSISPPKNYHFVSTGDTAGIVTLSPDGRYAAFVAGNTQGQMLWLDSFDTGNVVPLAGTQQAMFPFWNPNSREIGFFASGKLMVVDIDGGAPRVIAEAADGRGGAWGPGDEIIFTPFVQAGIWRIKASGGPPVQITNPRPPYTTNRWPAFLPDGKHFVYLAANHSEPAGADTAIFLASLDGKENRKLLPSLGNAVPWGRYLLYPQSNRLLARRLEDGQLQGDAIRISDNVLYDPGTWRAGFSISQSGLLATHPSGGTVGSRLLWFDRAGKQTGEIPPIDTYGDLSISPDGSKIAMGVGDPKSAIYLYDLRRGVRTRFSFAEGTSFRPIWSHDARNVIFRSGGSAPGDGSLMIKAADGSTPERVLTPVQFGLATDVSPDGRVVLCSIGQSVNEDIVAIPLAGGPPVPVVKTPQDEYDGRFSPDGHWIVYASVDHGIREIFVTPYPGPGGKWQVSNGGALNAWWNPNGREIFFLSLDSRMFSVDVSVEGSSIQLGAPRPLFSVNTNTNNSGISVAPDGNHFLINTVTTEESGPATLITNWDAALK